MYELNTEVTAGTDDDSCPLDLSAASGPPLRYTIGMSSLISSVVMDGSPAKVPAAAGPGSEPSRPSNFPAK